MTLDQFLALVFFGAVVVCGIALYIDGLGGWAMYRAERRRKKRPVPKEVK